MTAELTEPGLTGELTVISSQVIVLEEHTIRP